MRRAARARARTDARIRCQQAWHQVGISPKGQLILYDHPSLPAERVLVALGGVEPACLILRRYWRMLFWVSAEVPTSRLHLTGLPAPLHEAFLQAHARHRARADFAHVAK